jgi:hypothetical protein
VRTLRERLAEQQGELVKLRFAARTRGPVLLTSMLERAVQLFKPK